MSTSRTSMRCSGARSTPAPRSSGRSRTSSTATGREASWIRSDTSGTSRLTSRTSRRTRWRSAPPTRRPPAEPMLDHIGLNVSDYDRSREFYERALAPLGFSLLMEPMPSIGGFGRDGKPWFWINDQRQPTSENVHVAFTVPDRATVDAFHAAALEAGGTDNGAPGLREIYHPDYYGAYVLDPDGNNVEAVCHRPE